MRFSITIPAYKSQYLKEAVESVLAQTYQDWELIIVDDCSPENLYAIVSPYLSDSRIRYYKNQLNCGALNVVDNWNICLQYCSGDYVICIGDDDQLTPICLDEYRKMIERYPQLAVYHAMADVVDESGTRIRTQETRPEWESAISLLWNRWDHRSDQFIGDFCYNVSMLREWGGYFKLPLAWGSDDITAVRAAQVAGIANMQVVGFLYRQNSFTITNTKNARVKLEASLMAYDWFCNFLGQEAQKELQDSDKQMLSTIYDVGRRYYYKSLGKNCSDDLRGNPFKLLYWRRKMQPFRFSSLSFLKWYLKSLYNVLTNK